MQVRWLGWAGAEYEYDGATVVVDPLTDPAATFAGFGAAADRVELPEVVAPSSEALAGLVSHLHRDHTDAQALEAALAPGAEILNPEPWGDPNLALAQAEHELAAAQLPRRAVTVWDSVAVGPFTCTALPAVDGLGDPQVSWLVEAVGPASCTSATPSSTVAGGRWLGGRGRSMSCWRRSTAPWSTSPTSSRPARCRRRWSPNRRRSRASSSGPTR